jgi:soluble lytic murein transglycosylase-like protein
MKPIVKIILLAAAFTWAGPLFGIAMNNAAHAKSKHRGSDATVIITAAAYRYKVPTGFALRIARQETGVRCGLWGDHGRSGGPLQIFWPTAHGMFGVRSFKSFRRMSCAALTDLGMRHLAAAYRSAHGNQWLAALRHNGGIGAGPRNHKAARYANAVSGGKKHKARKHRRRK